MSILKNFISDKTKVLKVSLAVGGLAIVAAASMLATTAYLSATTNDKTNEFKPYTLTDTQITENGSTTGGNYQLQNDYQTSKYNYVEGKLVRIQNPSGANKKPVFVRVLATVEGVEQELETGESYYTFTKTTIDNTKNLNTDFWVYSDGYYYYRYVLYPGYQTQPLFTDGEIYFSDNENVTLTFTADTVQAWANGKRDVIDTSFAETVFGSLPTEVNSTVNPLDSEEGSTARISNVAIS